MVLLRVGRMGRLLDINDQISLMVKQKILQAYEQMAKKYDELIDHKPHNAYYDRPNTLQLIGDVAGKNILDAACGPGKYAEILMEAGAQVTGFDVSPTMVELAKARNHGKGHFFVHDLSERLADLADETFDIIVCALALHYIEDWTVTMQEFFRLLKAGGKLVISIEHPFSEYQYYQSKKYFEIEHVHTDWRGFGGSIEVHCYRRSLTDCLMPLIKAGFQLEEILEPKPTEEFEKLDPRHYQELMNFPAFLCLKAVKVR